ncbi:hypothetical protein FYZ45_10145 [Mobiluncus mulieris]|uniref:Uncharacterized protein n=1 Tax=Mobiluncus mulieris TaxID=2052 RepID=A0ABD4TZA9_9ACTO|nr:hypothetical protein [Mobiluncus mulieris]MCU9974125.1 hypothetical protein [Mobiluncus mulieris]MCV0010264.1 hypothetical protein [Mobiluncus mulieris]NMW75904.1 hypothetical protein [Mobiluncus mulieris]NMX02069.1 hypothetical protein [Mobiluncus mulieris]
MGSGLRSRPHLLNQFRVGVDDSKPGFWMEAAEINENLGVRLCIFEPHPHFFLNFCHAALQMTGWCLMQRE